MERLGCRQLLSFASGNDFRQSKLLPQEETSILAERLLLLVGWGLASSNTIRWVAEGAVLDACNSKQKPHPHIAKLSSCGADGQYPGNTRRDVLRVFCPSMQSPKPISITIPCKNKHDEIIWTCLLYTSPSPRD